MKLGIFSLWHMIQTQNIELKPQYLPFLLLLKSVRFIGEADN